MLLKIRGENGKHKVNAYDAYCIYTSCLLHFKPASKYDAFKFNFKGPRCKVETFEKHRARYDFEKISKRYNTQNKVIEFFVANIISDQTWVKDMNDATYDKWAGRIQAMDYLFKTSMSNLANQGLSFDDAFKINNGLPLIYKQYMAGETNLETLVVLDALTNFTRRLKNIKNDSLRIISDTTQRIVSYKPFLRSKINLEKNKNIVINTFTIT